MAYTEEEARKLVVRAGLALLENKLIARTWGNISARVSDSEFVITPSGREYDSLTEADLVKVRIDDLSYEGSIKPSSEKGVHGAAYALRPEVNFVIHTHQLYASAVCAEERDTDFAPCAAYGLPGTKKLTGAVRECIAAHPGSNAFLMAKHGTVLLGADYDEAFAAAEKLEEQSKAACERRAAGVKKPKLRRAWIDDYAQLIGNGLKKPPEEDAEAVRMICEKNEAAARYVRDAKPLNPFDVLLQRCVYLMKYSKQKTKNK